MVNGAEVGNIHISDHACTEIISHVAEEMHRKFVCNVKEMDSWVSITIDENTIYGSPLANNLHMTCFHFHFYFHWYCATVGRWGPPNMYRYFAH